MGYCIAPSSYSGGHKLKPIVIYRVPCCLQIFARIVSQTHPHPTSIHICPFVRTFHLFILCFRYTRSYPYYPTQLVSTLYYTYCHLVMSFCLILSCHCVMSICHVILSYTYTHINYKLNTIPFG